MKRLLSISFLLLVISGVTAQNQLVLTNVKKNKMIIVREGQTFSLMYKGYLGQTEFAKNMVTEITDSTVLLEIVPGSEFFWKSPLILSGRKLVKLNDIVAFRRITLGRKLLKSVLTTGAFLGSYLVLFNFYKSSNASVGRDLLLSVGVGLGSKLLIDAILPENPKYTMDDGWVCTVIHP